MLSRKRIPYIKGDRRTWRRTVEEEIADDRESTWRGWQGTCLTGGDLFLSLHGAWYLFRSNVWLTKAPLASALSIFNNIFFLKKPRQQQAWHCLVSLSDHQDSTITKTRRSSRPKGRRNHQKNWQNTMDRDLRGSIDAYACQHCIYHGWWWRLWCPPPPAAPFSLHRPPGSSHFGNLWTKLKDVAMLTKQVHVSGMEDLVLLCGMLWMRQETFRTP